MHTIAPGDPGTASRPGLLALVLLAPLAFGAAPAWGWSACAVGVALLVLAEAVGGAGTPAGLLPRWSVALAAAVAAVALWQAWAPIPDHPVRVATRTALAGVEASPALDPQAARATLVRLGSYAGVLWLAARGWSGRPRGPALLTVVAVATLYAVFGLAVRGLDLQGVLWLGSSAYDAASGPFVARGAFAAFCGLAMLAAAGLAVGGAGVPGPRWTLAALWLLLAGALLASQSRAGLAAALIGHLALGALLWWQGRLTGRAAAGAAGMLLLAGLLGALASGLDARLLASPGDLRHRLAIWRAALAAIAARPWLGHGLGTFPAIFELYRPAEAARTALSAHSGPLEWTAEAGLPAALAWHAALLGLALRCLERVRPATGGPAAPVAVAALIQVAAQGTLDFAPQVPAVALLTAFLLGLGLATAPPDSGPAEARR